MFQLTKPAPRHKNCDGTQGSHPLAIKTLEMHAPQHCEVTPLIQELLSIVRSTCRPSNADWATSFVQQIEELFYRPPAQGDQITAVSETTRHMRLLAVERLMTIRPRPNHGNTIHNFDK